MSVTGDLSSRRQEEKEPEAETRTPRAFSLPAREPGDELDPDNLLDWFKTDEEQSETAETPSGQEAVLDDWLNELSDIEPADADSNEELSDWFQEAGEVEEATEESEGLASWFSDSDDTLVEEGGVSDWLAELENADADEEDEQPAIDETIPDWLSELDEEAPEEPSGEDSLADWLSDFNLEDETAEGETELPETDILSPVDSFETDIADTLIAPSPMQEEEAETPDWFSDFAEAEDDAEPEEASPDWLSEFELEEDTPTLIESTPVQEEDDEELPDWLSEFETDEEMPTLIASAPEGEADAEIPDWLSDLGGSDDDMPTLIASTPDMEEEEALPDWLGEAALEEETADEASLPDWLSEPATEAETADEESLPEWLSETATEETAEEEPLPDWLSETTTEPETAEEESLPDWLSETATEAETADAESLPDWLSDVGTEETGAADEEAMPDWLGEAAPAEEETGEEALPDWLSDFESGDEETAEEESALPDWLGEFSESDDEPELATLESETAGEGSLTDWLSDFEDDDSDTIDMEETAAQDLDTQWEQVVAEGSPQWAEDIEGGDEIEDGDGGEMPDWLSDMPSYDTRILSSEELEEEGDSADLFAELSDPNLAPVDELPDWLSDLGEAEAEPEIEPDSEAVETSEEDDGFPDWMAELSEEADTVDTFDPGGDTDWLAALAQEDEWPEVADDEEIVAQLDDLHEAPAETSGPSQELKGVPKELAGSSLPDWLAEDMPESGLVSDEVADEDPFGLGADQLAQGELPDWLQQMKPADVSQPTADLGLDSDFPTAETQDEWQKILENMPPSPETMPGASGLSAAEIPGWLQALKPRDIGEAQEDLPDFDEPPETSGPLMGLRGVLPAAAVMTEAVAAKTPAQYTISKEQQQQIALLHRLTHEEPEATKQVSFKQAATFSSSWRALLGVLLFLVVLAGVILPRTDIGLPETSLPVPQSAFDAYNRVNEAAGRPVLVAFEYTPAMAGELDPIAQMLLRQLAENGNKVLTISQSAVGTAIANRAVADVDGLDSRALGLLPGEAVGLRNLGSCLNSADDCDFLLGSNANPESQTELADIGLIIVLTSDRSSLVNWIEQVERQKDVPVIAAVTQPLGPLTIPYISSGQLEGTLNGIPAASAYEKRLRGIDGSAFQEFTAQTIVMWVVIVALIVAAVVYGTAGLAGRRSNKGSR